MKRYVYGLILLSLLLPAFVQGQQLPFFEGFETGNTHNAPIQGWIQESVAGDGIPWTANNSYINYNRAPRTGSWNAFLQYNNSRWMFRALNLQGGIPYRISLYARQDTGNAGEASIAISYGLSATAAGMSHSILAPTGIVNGAYQKLQGTFTPASSGTWYIGILGTISYAPWYISLDDITIEVAPTTPQLAYSPAALDFGNVLYGVNSDPLPLTIRNSGGGNLQLSAANFSLLGSHASFFSFDSSVLPQALGADASFNLPISLTPFSEGNLSATLRIAYAGQHYDIPLSAFVLPASTQNYSIGTGTAASRFPLGSYYGFERSAALYLADEIGEGNKRISALAWYATQASGDQVPTRIYLKNYAQDMLVADSWANLISGATLVYNATDSGIFANEWKSYILHNTFDLDSGNNLLVLVERNTGGYGGSAGENAPAIRATEVPGLHQVFLRDNTPPTTTGSMQSLRPNIRLTASTYQITAPPLPAILLAPANGAEMQPLQLSLAWNSGGGAPAGFRLHFGSENPPPLVAELGMAYTYEPANLQAGNTYYWQIVPYNSYGDAPNCPVWSFSTIPVGMAEIGTDTQNSSYPFYSLYESARTQMLFTMDELCNSGISPYSYIHRLGFNIAFANPIVLNNLQIRLKHTDATSLEGFDQDAGAFTSCYLGNVSLVNGWFYFDFSEHFLYNGEQNLIVDISYTNQIWADNSRVYASTAMGKTWAAHGEIHEGQGALLGGGTAQNLRPNLRLFSTPPNQLAPYPPQLSYPANGATNLPLEGFYLRWLPDLISGGIPEYYALYLSQAEEDLFSDLYFETFFTRFDPVQDGGITLGYNQRWYWAVEAINSQGVALSEVSRFDTASPPPEIAVSITSYSAELDSGESLSTAFNISNTGASPLEYSLRFIGDEPASGRARFDLQFAFTPSGGGEYGITYADGYFYSSQWEAAGNSCNFFKYDLQGNLLATINIAGISQIRDLAYDGRYFYGTNATNTIYKLDLESASLLGTISAPVNARGISYDSLVNGLWISNNWNAPLYLISLEGNTLRILDSALEGVAGIAFEYFGDSPTIWANTHNGHLNNTLIQIDYYNGNIIGTYPLTEALFPFLSEYSTAGGIQVVAGIIPGTASILATSQNEVIYGLEYAPAAGWASVYPQAGKVAAGASQQIELRLSAAKLGAGTYSGNLVINSNAPGEPLELPISLSVSGDWLPQYSLSPSAWDFGQMELLNPISQTFSIYNGGGYGLMLAPGDIYIQGDSEGNFQLQAHNLPQSLDYNQTYRFDIVFCPQSPGSKSAQLMVQDNLNRTLHSYPLSGWCIDESIGQVVGLQAMQQNYRDVLLSWGVFSGEPAEPGWLYYDNDNPSTGVGTGQTGEFDVAIKFDSVQLWDYAGMYLEKIRFFPSSGNTNYSLQLWTGYDASLAPNALVYSQALSNLNINQWNEIVLSTPYQITAESALWIGYHCEVQAGEQMHPAGADSGPALVGKGDLLGVDGTWQSLYEAQDLDANWCLRAYLNYVNPQTSALGMAPIELSHSRPSQRPPRFSNSGNFGNATRALRGFNIYRNGTQINSELLQAMSYLDSNLPDGSYTYAVEAVYYSQITPLSQPATVSISAPPALSLPFEESWDSLSFATNYWVPAADNWDLSLYGNPSPAAGFFWEPMRINYDLPLRSYNFDASGMDTVYLGFDLSLENFSYEAENWLFWEVWDGNAWHTLGSYSSYLGDLPWSRYSLNISQYAANREFQVRFRAAGEDSYELEAWYLDNITISDTPTLLPAVSGLQLEIADNMLNLSWEAVPGASWYQIYTSDDPYGIFEALDTCETNSYSLPLEASKAFFRITAGM